MKTINVLFVFMLAVLILPGCKKALDEFNNITHNNHINGQDKTYLVQSAQGSKQEIILGNIAQTHAANPDVKAFGARMIEDHSKENVEVKSLAAIKNVSVPDEPSEEQQKKIDELSKLNGDAFDKAYMAYMVKDHEGDIEDTKEELKNGSDPDVLGFANKFLPVLETHLSIAKNVAKEVGAL